MSHALTADQKRAITTSFKPGVVVHAHRGTDAAVSLPVIDGTVTLDGSSQERTTVTLRLPLDYAPTDWSSLLVPADCQIDVLYSLGVGPNVKVAHVWLDDARIARPDGFVDITAVSRATRVSQAGFPNGSRVYTGSTVHVVEAIVESCLGRSVTVSVRGGLVGPTVVAQQAFEGDPWQVVEDLMDAAGGEAYFDTDDVLVMRPVPKALPPTTATLTVGESGTMTRYEVSLTRAPNSERMSFRNPVTNKDVVGRANATGSAAPSGPYGYYRDVQTRDGVVSQAQADAAAVDFLTRSGGLLRGLVMYGVPDPSIEVGDAVAVTFVNGITETHRVTRVVLPITPGQEMVLETRSLPW